MSTTELVHVQPTPNPNAFKFHTTERLVPEGQAISFANAESAESLPIAKALFAQGDVTAVLVADDFVSVSGTADADWQQIRALVDEHLPKFDLEAAARLAEEQRAAEAEAKASRPVGDVEKKIEEVFDDYVRPALAGDGGGIQVLGVEGKTVLVRYQGACGSCPTSTANTLAAIENLLRDQVDPDIVVEPA
jgi:Fe-S cluster biogenesis protein NfuA